MQQDYDFCGYATKYDTRCADGRIIDKGAFAHQDHEQVPLLYQHNKKNIDNFLGEATLEHRDDGVYVYGKFNTTESGQKAKILVKEGNIKAMSINAVRVLETPEGEVTHGDIREVSLVLHGANPGARIDNVIAHSEDGDYLEEKDDEFIIYNGENIDFKHADADEKESDDDDKTVGEVIESLNPDQKNMFNAMYKLELAGEEITDEIQEHISVVMATCTDDQKLAIASVMDEVAKAREAASAIKDDADNGVSQSDDSTETEINHSEDEGEDDKMAHLFNEDQMKKDKENEATKEQVVYEELTHDEQKALFQRAQRSGKNLNEFLTEFAHGDDNQNKRIGVTIQHAVAEQYPNVEGGGNNMGVAGRFPTAKGGAVGQDNKFGMGGGGSIGNTPYGFANAGYVFPEYSTMNKMPLVVDDDYSWVEPVLKGTSKYPSLKFRNLFADITDSAMRARGYVTGNLKKEQVFKLLRRSTDGTTIYAKQKMDKDMIYDITDFNAWVWVKSFMQKKLREEIARDILVGDGRASTDPDHVDEECIRPIYGDVPLYTIYADMPKDEGKTPAEYSGYADQLIEKALRARSQYKGTGEPTMYISPYVLTTLLLAQDKLGQRKFKSVADIKTYFRASNVQEVELFDTGEAKRTPGEEEYTGEPYTSVDNKTCYVQILFVNIKDYTVGSNNGGAMFNAEDFNLDYNQYIALTETRLSGALNKPKAAIAMEIVMDSTQAATYFADRYHHPLEGAPEAGEDIK